MLRFRIPWIILGVFAILLAGVVTADTGDITPLDRARTYIVRGEFDSAREILEKQERENPEDPRVYAMLAWLEEKNGNLSRAAESMEKAHQLAPMNQEYTRSLADLLFQINDNEKALTLYRELSSRDPRDVDILLGIARIHWRLKEYSQGLSATEAAEAVAPDNPDVYILKGELYYFLNRPEDTAENYRKALNLGGGDRNLYYRLGNLYEDTDQLDSAIAINHEILDKYPDQLEPYRNLSRLYRMKGENYQSFRAWVSYTLGGTAGSFMAGAMLGFAMFFLMFFKAFRFINSLLLLPVVLLAGGLGQVKLLSFLSHISRVYALDHLNFLCNFEISLIDPENAMARRNLGSFYEKRGNMALAQRNFEAAVEIDPGMGQVWFSLGSIYLKQKEYKKAEVSLRKALSAGDDSFLTWYHLSLAFYNQESYQEAMEASREALEQSAQFTPPLDIYVESCESLGLIDQCRDFLLNLKRENPQSNKITLDLGNLYLSTGKARESLRFFEESIELSPDSHETWYNFGVAQREAGLLENATNSLRRALELSPDAGWIHTSLGLTSLMRGKTQQAEENLKKALKLSPGSAYTHFLMGILTLKKDPSRSEIHIKQALEGFRAELAKLTKPWQKANEYQCIGIAHQLQGETTSAREAFLQAIKYAGITPEPVWIFSEEQMKLTPSEQFIKECRGKLHSMEPEAPIELSADKQIS